MRHKELHLDCNGQTFINTYVSEDADSGTGGRSAYLSALLWFALKKYASMIVSEVPRANVVVTAARPWHDSY